MQRDAASLPGPVLRQALYFAKVELARSTYDFNAVEIYAGPLEEIQYVVYLGVGDYRHLVARAANALHYTCSLGQEKGFVGFAILGAGIPETGVGKRVPAA